MASQVFDHYHERIIEVGAADKLPEQVEFVHREASEANYRVTQLEEQVEVLREALSDLGGPVYAERLRRPEE